MSFAACRGLSLYVGNVAGKGVLQFSDGTEQTTAYTGTLSDDLTLNNLTVNVSSNLGGTTNITGNVSQKIGNTFNTQYGYNALPNLTTSIQNTAIGYEAIGKNTTGSFNTSIGDYSLSDNDTGTYNTAVGHFSSIYNITGVNNTSVGSNSLENNESGAGNTCIGFSTGTSIKNEINNTCLGSESDISSGYSNSTAIGYKSKCTASNQIMLGTTGQTVQIPGNLTTNGVFPISGSTLDLGSDINTVSIPGTMNVGLSVSIGSADNGLTNNIYAKNNTIYASDTNRFESTANNFIGTNSFTAGVVNINDVATFNSGFKCGTQSTAYILYFGTATVAIGGQTSETTTQNTYSICTLDNSFPTTVVGAVVSSGSQNFICDFMGPSSNPSINQINVVFKNITNNAQGLPNSIFYIAWGY